MKKVLGWGIPIAICLFLVFFIGCERIDAGHVGLKVNMSGGNKGVSKSEYVTGWVFYLKTATKVYEFPTYQQHKEYDPFTVPSKGGTVFTVHPAFNYAVNPGEVANMFTHLRQSMANLENGYIFNAVRIALRETTNRFTVDSMLNNVSIYDAAVTEALDKQLSPWFTVSQFTSNLTPDDNLKNTLAKKALAIQEALQLENEQKKIRVQAENDIIEARRDSTVKVVNAKAEATSIAVVQQALANSPQFVEKIKAERWDGKLPQYMLGGGTGLFLNMKTQ
jgi:regulator of protease activity HflC (stomatin/prohibitin superfamily)